MRADRLLSLLLYLQSRGQLSATELAGLLDVSVRTVYRDIDALCSAGIPIYAETGREGGYRLLEHYRSTLNGLTGDEIASLLMFNVPESLASLDAGQKLKNAMLKLVAAFGQQNAPPIYLDWEAWAHDPVPHLPLLYQAVRECFSVSVFYRVAGRIDIRREIEPYGLVAKAGDWYLIYHGGGRLHVARVSDLLDVDCIGTRFTRSADFDLIAYWKDHCANRMTETYPVMIRMRGGLVTQIGRFLKRHQARMVSEDGEISTFELTFESIYEARSALLALGGAVEVLEPEPLRRTLADFAAQVVKVYEG